MQLQRGMGLAAATALLLIGCGRAPAIYPVQGKVVWTDGSAATELAGYAVSFESEDKQTSGSGLIEADGSFKIGTLDLEDGALVGKHRVALTPPEPPTDAPRPPRLIDERFQSFETSGLAAEIKPGENPVELKVDRAAR